MLSRNIIAFVIVSTFTGTEALKLRDLQQEGMKTGVAKALSQSTGSHGSIANLHSRLAQMKKGTHISEMISGGKVLAQYEEFLSSRAKKEARRIMQKYDTHDHGTVQADEMREYLTELSKSWGFDEPIDDEDIDDAFEVMDVDENGEVTEKEVALFIQILIEEELF